MLDLTLRQVVYGWAMVQVFRDRDISAQAVAVRNSRTEKDEAFEHWLAKME